MHQEQVTDQIVSYPKMRRLEALAYRSVLHKPMMHGLIEVDVTRARWFLRDQKANKGGSVVYSIPYCLSGESGRRAQSGASFSTRE